MLTMLVSVCRVHEIKPAAPRIWDSQTPQVSSRRLSPKLLDSGFSLQRPYWQVGLELSEQLPAPA